MDEIMHYVLENHSSYNGGWEAKTSSSRLAKHVSVGAVEAVGVGVGERVRFSFANANGTTIAAITAATTWAMIT
jgi:hypothetical protein